MDFHDIVIETIIIQYRDIKIKMSLINKLFFININHGVRYEYHVLMFISMKFFKNGTEERLLIYVNDKYVRQY